MVRKRKIPSSYRVREWYQGEVSSDSEQEGGPPKRRATLNREEPVEIFSDPPSDPASSRTTRSPGSPPRISGSSSDLDVEESGSHHVEESDVELPSPLPSDLDQGFQSPDVEESGSQHVEEPDVEESDVELPSPLPSDLDQGLLSPDVESGSHHVEEPDVVFPSPLDLDLDDDPGSPPDDGDDDDDDGGSPPPPGSPLPPDDDDDDDWADSYQDLQDEIHFHDFYEEVCKDWLDTEVDHNVSKTATNIFWRLACTKIVKLFELKRRQNITRKVPQFQQVRKSNLKHIPPIEMEIGYMDKTTGDVIIESQLKKTPVKMYPPSQFQKVYEIASVKVS